MKPSDWETVRKIKKIIQDLPDLDIPPPHCFIIIETDGCMEGWVEYANGRRKRLILCQRRE